MKSMIKQMWNERYNNLWLFVELLIIFVLLWYIVDYTWNYLYAAAQPKGFNTENVFDIRVRTNNLLLNDATLTKEARINYTHEVFRRISEYPGVESACYYRGSMPYTNTSTFEGYSAEGDTTSVCSSFIRYISPGYPDVFQVELESGNVTGWENMGLPRPALLTRSLADSLFSGKEPVGKRFYNYYARLYGMDLNYYVSGILPPTKLYDYGRYEEFIYVSMDEKDFLFTVPNIAVRVKPEMAGNFAERFMGEMKDKLNVGPLYLSEVQSYAELKEVYDVEEGISGRLRTAGLGIVFFVFNIFFGILGTFWFRTRKRREELGIRMALGSSHNQLRKLILGEGMLLLTFAVAIGIIIAANINLADLTVNTLTDPSFSRFIITVLITITLMAIMVIGGSWYPAYQTMRLKPVEALRDE